jgi:hypothetical protein
MLRITAQSSADVLTFRLEGKLVGEWANELEQAWTVSAAALDGRKLIVDLTETLFIDAEGRRVLANLFRRGAKFRTACPMIDSIVSEITGETTGKPRALPGALPACLLACFVALGARAAQPPSQVQPAPLRLTLRDAVGTALKRNPQMQVANLNVAVTQENWIVAGAALLPQANIAVSEAIVRESLVANARQALAREEVTQARDQFQAGVANHIEVATAQDELAGADRNQIVALDQYNQARADLALATGQMEWLYNK